MLIVRSEAIADASLPEIRAGQGGHRDGHDHPDNPDRDNQLDEREAAMIAQGAQIDTLIAACSRRLE